MVIQDEVSILKALKKKRSLNTNVLFAMKTRLDALSNASRRIDQFVKEFLSKHQEVFQKALDVFENALSSVSIFIFPARHFKFNRFALSLHRKRR